MILSLGNAKGQDCVFSKDYFKSQLAFLKSIGDVESIVWSDSLESASMLMKDGELVRAQLWACNSAGTRITSYYSISAMDENLSGLWESKLIQLGKKCLMPMDFTSFRNAVENTSWTEDDLIEPTEFI